MSTGVKFAELGWFLYFHAATANYGQIKEASCSSRLFLA
jgi:hypothetical protein